MKTYARKCDITGEGMDEGFCIGDGYKYIKYEEDMIKYLREIEKKGNPEYDTLVKEGRLTDEWLLTDYYNADYYYWTEWEEADHQYAEVNGELVDIDELETN